MSHQPDYLAVADAKLTLLLTGSDANQQYEPRQQNAHEHRCACPEMATAVSDWSHRDRMVLRARLTGRCGVLVQQLHIFEAHLA